MDVLYLLYGYIRIVVLYDHICYMLFRSWSIGTVFTIDHIRMLESKRGLKCRVIHFVMAIMSVSVGC